MAAGAEPITLNRDDQFEDLVSRLIELNRRKRADYARDDDPWSNFRHTAQIMALEGLGALEVVRTNIAQKMARLAALAANGRSPGNESVADTWQDMAVYAIIGVILAEETGADPAPARALLERVKATPKPKPDLSLAETVRKVTKAYGIERRTGGRGFWQGPVL